MAALWNLAFIGKQKERTLRKSVGIEHPGAAGTTLRSNEGKNHARRCSLLPSIKDSTKSWAKGQAIARHNLSAVVRYLHQLAGSAGASGASDAELLERYVRHRDEAAFELLVWRHGGLLFNVCRRILPREQDAEDAFQATFLVLVRKAAPLDGPQSLGPWLCGVANRTALKLRGKRAHRATWETPLPEQIAEERAEPIGSDVRPILDEEINRLPTKYRLPERRRRRVNRNP
jgi:RNA polymerase sigma factor (sigma-70 family)